MSCRLVLPLWSPLRPSKAPLVLPLLGRSWGPLRPSWRPLAVLTPSWAVLEPAWGPLEPSWGDLGGLLGRL
eukprot:8591248-Pyramimonas_sp.AAC.1